MRTSIWTNDKKNINPVGNDSLNSFKELAMFSGMGNGFTFELESIIFYALAKACEALYDRKAPDLAYNIGGKFISIHGDDLVIPRHLYPLFSFICPKIGLTINAEKTCVSGRFRESCGGDYLDGTQVRPFYIKDRMTSARLIGFLNHCNRADVNVLSHEAYLLLEKEIPKVHILYGPDGFGDGHLIYCDYHQFDVSSNHTRGHCLHAFYSFKKIPISSDQPLSKGDQLSYLYDTMFYKSEDISRVSRDPYVIGGMESSEKGRICVVGRPKISFYRYPAIVTYLLPTPILG